MEPAAANLPSREPERARYLVVGIGELLWDILPTGERLGGAPANFACLAALLGDDGVIASRIGADARGARALAQVQQLGLTVAHLQVAQRRPTGTVEVQLDERGKPTFTIPEGSAWDEMDSTADWQALAGRADAVCFGSLAQRASRSRATIRRFLDATRKETLALFDVNLRAPFYSAEVIFESLKRASVVKLNDDELPIVLQLTGLNGTSGAADGARGLLEAFDLQMVCLTRGDRGSLLISREEVIEHTGLQVDVADTVGAGDAFSAALAYYYLRGASMEQISEAANRLGSWVATQVGAIPATGREGLAWFHLQEPGAI